MVKCIIHAGGLVYDETNTKSYKYTNSVEAIEYNISIDNKDKIIEVDVVMLGDGNIVIAHDYTEKSIYNSEKKFNEMTIEEYKSLRVYNKFTPLTFEKLNEIITDVNKTNRYIRIVLDIKENGEDYEKSIKYICNILGNNIKYIIPQIYNVDDLLSCIKYNMSTVLFASYKIVFNKPLKIINEKLFQDTLDVIVETSKKNNVELLGMSIHTNYINSTEINMLSEKYQNIIIFYHGQSHNDEHEYLYTLSNVKNTGLFTHSYISWRLLELFDTKRELLYLPSHLINNRKTNLFNKLWNDFYKRIFTILNNEKLDYYVFAGTLVGYARNKRNLPFADDYDIMIFKNEEKKMDRILNILKKNGLNYGLPHIARPDLYPTMAGWQLVGYIGDVENPPMVGKGILFDIFLSEVVDGIVKNTGKFGVYHYKNIPDTLIYPSSEITIDDITLKTVNKIDEYIEKEYGNVINNVNIYSSHGTSERILINAHYSHVYKILDTYIETAKQNTLKKIHFNWNDLTNKTYSKHILIKSKKFKDAFEILEYINTNLVSKISFTDVSILAFSYDIKYYFPNIELYYYIIDDYKEEYFSKYLHMYNYIDHIYCPNKEIFNKINDNDICYIRKPKISMIKIITFGTYDLFHYGHNNLFKRCKQISDYLKVGVSSDVFNKIKGKESINNIEKRIKDVKNNEYVDDVFVENSFEEKYKYVKESNVNLLVMGDDWKDKFDNLDIMTHYFERTPNISTTILKKI